MIIIHTGGNEKIGIGNLSRCRTLAEQLVINGVKNIVMVYETTKELGRKFIVNNVNTYIVQTRDEALKIRDKVRKEYSYEKAILITDIYDLNLDDHKFAKNQGFDFLIHLNDSGIPEYSPDLMVDQEAFIKPWLKSEKIKFLHGAKYNIMRSEITNARQSQPWNKEKVDKILLCFGGADPGHFIEKFIKYKYIYKFKKVKFTVVVGPGVSDERWNIIKQVRLDNVVFERCPSNLEKLMVENDLIVTLGGMTSYEGMCIGRPVACLLWEGMSYYVEQLDKFGLVKNIGKENEAFDNLLKILQNVEELKIICDKGWNEVDGEGANRIVQYIIANVLN